MSFFTPNEENSIGVRTCPGGMWWIRRADGSYEGRRAVFGGSGNVSGDVEFIAEKLAYYCWCDFEPVLLALEKLGWDDVLIQFRKKLSLKIQEVRLEKIKSLQDRIEGFRSFIAKHQGWDYWMFRKEVYDDIVRASGGIANEEDISVRRMHYAAQDGVSAPQRLVELEAELAELMNTEAIL